MVYGLNKDFDRFAHLKNILPTLAKKLRERGIYNTSALYNAMRMRAEQNETEFPPFAEDIRNVLTGQANAVIWKADGAYEFSSVALAVTGFLGMKPEEAFSYILENNIGDKSRRRPGKEDILRMLDPETANHIAGEVLRFFDVNDISEMHVTRRGKEGSAIARQTVVFVAKSLYPNITRRALGKCFGIHHVTVGVMLKSAQNRIIADARYKEKIRNSIAACAPYAALSVTSGMDVDLDLVKNPEDIKPQNRLHKGNFSKDKAEGGEIMPKPGLDNKWRLALGPVKIPPLEKVVLQPRLREKRDYASAPLSDYEKTAPEGVVGGLRQAGYITLGDVVARDPDAKLSPAILHDVLSGVKPEKESLHTIYHIIVGRLAGVPWPPQARSTRSPNRVPQAA